jgi:hypothetical protein
MLGMSDFVVISVQFSGFVPEIVSTEGSLCALSSSSRFDGKCGAGEQKG